jgi:hypothetical protein
VYNSIGFPDPLMEKLVILQIRLYALYNRSTRLNLPILSYDTLMNIIAGTKIIVGMGILFTIQMVSVSVLAGLEVAATVRE